MSNNVARWVSRHRKIAASVLAAGIAAAFVWVPLASSSAATSRTTSAPVPAAAAQRLGTIMKQMATVNGDASPASMQAVTTTRDKALRIATPGDLIPGSASQTVYLAVMKGNFTLNDAPRPAGSPAPTGHYLLITFSPGSFHVMDLGLSNQAPTAASLRALGPVSTLTP
jgi:hypothetical protein